MAIFHSYVSLPEGTPIYGNLHRKTGFDGAWYMFGFPFFSTAKICAGYNDRPESENTLSLNQFFWTPKIDGGPEDLQWARLKKTCSYGYVYGVITTSFILFIWYISNTSPLYHHKFLPEKMIICSYMLPILYPSISYSHGKLHWSRHPPAPWVPRCQSRRRLGWTCDSCAVRIPFWIQTDTVRWCPSWESLTWLISTNIKPI